MSLKIDQSKPVLVTGANGYVAGRLVERLLKEGITVHAAVRDPGDARKTRHLTEVAQRLGGTIRFFKADLLAPGSYREAMEGCDVVFHTASPFVTKVRDPQRDLVDPAVKGTRNVLETVNGVESVRRVVLTSSTVAIYGDNQDVARAPNGILTEEVWNETSTLSHNPYFLSKTLAEREAWAMEKSQKRWDLVVINPTLVIGPGLNPDASSESFSIFRQLGDGTMAMGVPNLSLGVVDVRDVAEAHFQAAFRTEAEGRHIVSAANISLLELGRILSRKHGNAFPLPTRLLPKALVWMAAPFIGLTRTYVSRNVGHEFKADHSKSRRELGLNYLPVETTVLEFFDQLVNAGQIKKRAHNG